jgi:hypothetical protein
VDGAAGGLAQEEVRRLDIAVHDAARVQGREPKRGLTRDLERLATVERLAALPPGEIFPLEPVDRDIGSPLRACAVRDVAHDVGVVDLGEQPHLAREAIERVAVVARREHLDRDGSPGRVVVRPEDIARGALAGLFEQMEAAVEDGLRHAWQYRPKGS